jgi:D-alanyl-D-alanine carboxypeptidase
MSCLRPLILGLAASAVIACGPPPESPAIQSPLSSEWLQGKLDRVQADRPDVPGLALSIIHRGQRVSAATGQADPTGRPMTSGTPVRQASITKTYVAAAVLRLWEQGRIDLEASIDGLVSPEHVALLRRDGYEPSRLTVRGLFMHSSGLNDHFGSDAFTQAVLAEPRREWTRTEQLAFMTSISDPLEHQESRFAYSDSGYLLLGEALETVTGQALPVAVAELNRFDALGLGSTWWDEQRPGGRAGPERAHQYLEGMDTFGIHGSVDAFGGGGVVASSDDVAAYFDALFADRVFGRPETLEQMTAAPGHPPGSPYRIGLFVRDLGEFAGYGHGGFWGTDVVVYPELDLVIAGVALEQGGVDAIRALQRDVAERVAARSN